MISRRTNCSLGRKLASACCYLAVAAPLFANDDGGGTAGGICAASAETCGRALTATLADCDPAFLPLPLTGGSFGGRKPPVPLPVLVLVLGEGIVVVSSLEVSGCTGVASKCCR